MSLNSPAATFVVTGSAVEISRVLQPIDNRWFGQRMTEPAAPS